MIMNKTRMILAGGLMAAMTLSPVQADEHSGTYAFDREGQHQFIQFKIGHLGFSYLYGRFNDFDGEFVYDAGNPENSSVTVTIDTASVDSNHGERDRHLRSDDFLHVDEYPQATFKSTSVEMHSEEHATVTGDFTLRGVTREVDLDMKMVGHGDDPWGGYRMGFAGTTTLTLDDFGIPKDLGPSAQEVEIILSVEGVRQ
ncbi:MAG: YceI family protein [Oleiphilaceae bacterium]|nr:YceI family protein [Oleiphilaceae bacterium]